MAYYEICGGRRLTGEVAVGGAKNSVLPLLAASLLCGGEVILHGCPDLSDVHNSLEILRHLTDCAPSFEKGTLRLAPVTRCGDSIPDELVRRMRSSVVFLGAMLARRGQAVLTYPGGCALGSRPIDLHLNGLRRLGAQITEADGRIECSTPDGLRAGEISLSFPSVGATENLMIAACGAVGETVIGNAAREPEILDLAAFLNRCGADVAGAGGSSIRIRGGKPLSGCEFTVMPDRIEAATFLSAAAACGGAILARGARRCDMEAVAAALGETGARLSDDEQGIYLVVNRRPKALGNLVTMPYPGFPTDAQPLFSTLMTVADGRTVVRESIFENRLAFAGELTRMGADIRVYDRMAVIEGRNGLTGADVEAADLRGGAALIVAGLAARGTTRVHDTLPVERGYERIEAKLTQLGAEIRRLPEPTP